MHPEIKMTHHVILQTMTWIVVLRRQLPSPAQQVLNGGGGGLGEKKNTFLRGWNTGDFSVDSRKNISAENSFLLITFSHGLLCSPRGHGFFQPFWS